MRGCPVSPTLSWPILAAEEPWTGLMGGKAVLVGLEGGEGLLQPPPADAAGREKGPPAFLSRVYRLAYSAEPIS